MCAPGEIGRSQQISKARGVALSQLLCSIEATAEAGRTGGNMIDATCAQAGRLMYQSLHPSVVPHIIADTMQHMIRMDFIIVMQTLCSRFEVPSLTASELEGMLVDGNIPDQVSIFFSQSP
jgi:hypothetical protein